MNLGLKGKIAFVGGSSSGLGEAVAKSLAAEGANIVLCAIDQEGLDRVAKEIKENYGVEVLALRADFGLHEDLNNVVIQTLERFGHVDILFNNTGGPPSCRFEDTTPDMWDKATTCF